METSLCLYPVLAVQEVYSSLVVARREVKTTRFWWWQLWPSCPYVWTLAV